MVSRLRKPAEVRDILAALRRGEGRHPDRHAPPALARRRAPRPGPPDPRRGTAVRRAPEGAAAPAQAAVDVLSLSATPIPRTLQMSLAGLRDISVIETPPEGRRPIRTYVGPFEEELVARAIKREAERGGQAFFLHNRIDTLHETAERLRALCPGRQLRRGARADGRGRAGGGDARLPAWRAGLPGGDDDHRVGARHPPGEHPDRRARRPARAGPGLPDPRPRRPGQGARLRIPPLSLGGRPRSRGGARAWRPSPTTPSSARASRSRCATSSCAAPATCSATSSPGTWPRSGSSCTWRCWTRRSRRCGPRAMGPGAESRVRFDVDVDAYLPADYIPFEAAKIDVHRRVAAAREPGELRALRDELRDRFGPPPDPVDNLLELQRARVELGRLGAQCGRVSRRAPLDHPARARRRRPSGACASRCRRRSTSCATKTLGPACRR